MTTRGATTLARLTSFDPRTLLKQIAIPLLQKFFEQRNELLDVPWQKLRETKLIGPIYTAWQQLPEPRRREVHAILHEIVEASGEHGMEQAAKESKYTFVFVWKQDDDATQRMRNVFMTALAKVPERAIATEVLISAANQREFVEEYGLERAPLPLVLAIAPNGAITGGFPTQFTDEDLLGAFATPATEKAMKQLQVAKLVLLCVQNDSSTERETALAAVREFQREPRFANASEIVMLDPADTAETSFLNDLKINPAITAAVTVILAPPGSPIGIFEGPVSKQHLIETIDKAGSGCCPGGKCGPNGCGPK